MKVGIYARVSTRDKQETENQLIQLREYAKKQNWIVHKEYVDKETGSTSNRIKFQELFTDAYQRKFDLVLFWALDRFSREGVVKTFEHLSKLTSYGVDYVSYTEQYINSTGIFREAIIAILATIAKQERIRLSERVKAGLERAKLNGKKLGKPKLDEKKVKKIIKLRKKGVSLRKISIDLKISYGSVFNYGANIKPVN